MKNFLPYDGIVNYYEKIFDMDLSDIFFDTLLKNIEWKNDEAIIYGKHIITKRKVAWYGEKPYEYKYSNITKTALLWTPELIEIKKVIETISGEHFNSCLLNLYHNGDEGMAWHSDGEKDLKKDGAIASISFGAERKFSFKHKETKETVSLLLEHGSLLVMAGTTQSHWQHRLPPTKRVFTPRINLTFRQIEN
ncbi:MAG: alpha-ketoglutarate-dependent dioxygenase AlkB [Sphingobacteriales bacterium]|nr:alpha-ketoglutarate-dependent dioxygenase AlkB [Sphingobacteriales bacterium]